MPLGGAGQSGTLATKVTDLRSGLIVFASAARLGSAVALKSTRTIAVNARRLMRSLKSGACHFAPQREVGRTGIHFCSNLGS